MPISAPSPNSPPSANWVEALTITIALSTSARKPLGDLAVGGDDGVGVCRGMARDVCERGVEPIDHRDRENGVEVFAVPVVGAGRPDPRIERLRARVAAQLAARPRAAPARPRTEPGNAASSSSVSVAPQMPVRRILALSASLTAMAGSAAEWT
jgi:hypothetical protein